MRRPRAQVLITRPWRQGMDVIDDAAALIIQICARARVMLSRSDRRADRDLFAVKGFAGLSSGLLVAAGQACAGGGP